MQEYQTADPSATQADRDTPKQAQAVGASITTKGTPRRKRTVQQIDAEEQADRAANEIVDPRRTGRTTRSRVPNRIQHVIRHAPVTFNGHGRRDAVGIHRTRGGGGDPRVGNQ